jgi:hypothetical protein
MPSGVTWQLLTAPAAPATHVARLDGRRLSRHLADGTVHAHRHLRILGTRHVRPAVWLDRQAQVDRRLSHGAHISQTKGGGCDALLEQRHHRMHVVQEPRCPCTGNAREDARPDGVTCGTRTGWRERRTVMHGGSQEITELHGTRAESPKGVHSERHER